MTIPPKRFLLIVLMVFIAAFMISVAVFSERKQEPKTAHAKEWLAATPVVLSKVKDLEIVNLRMVRADAKTPGIAFEIKNNSNKSVMAYQVACGDSAISQDGLRDEQNPIVIVEPHGMYSVEWNDDLTPGIPIVLTAAVFDDGGEEGDKVALKRVLRMWTHERAKKKALKEKAQRSPNQ